MRSRHMVDEAAKTRYTVCNVGPKLPKAADKEYSMIFFVLCGAFALISLITFCLYARDKRAAKKGNWRTPEKVLLLFSFFGGAIGGSLAMALLRHKTRHWNFVAVNAIGLLWQIAAIVAAAFFLL